MCKHIGRKRGILPRTRTKDRVKKATKLKSRTLSGWNVFLSEKLKNGNELSKSEYKTAVRRYGAEWKGLPQQAKSRYHSDARYQQACRDELTTRPLLKPADREMPTDTIECIAAEEHSTNSLEALAGNQAECSFPIFLCCILCQL